MAADRHPQLQVGARGGAAAGEVLDGGGEHGLHPVARREARAVQRRGHVRPPVGHAVHGGGGQAEVGVDPGGAAEVGERRPDEGVGDRRQLEGLLGFWPGQTRSQRISPAPRQSSPTCSSSA